MSNHFTSGTELEAIIAQESAISTGASGAVKAASNLNQYAFVWIRGRGHVGEHIVIAEKALGKRLPKGAEVHHANGNRKDNRPTNLVICESLKYHRLLHARQRIVDLGGDPDLQKVCHCCQQLLPRTEFHKCVTTYDGLQTACRSCHRGLKYPHLKGKPAPRREVA